ncbi:MAG: hypothetical protein AAF290_16535 [Pseudomonadota bacterium]
MRFSTQNTQSLARRSVQCRITNPGIALLALVALTTPFAPVQAQVIIDFENLPANPPGTPGAGPVLNQFAGSGVTFNRPIPINYAIGTLAKPDLPRSGSKAIVQCFAEEFCTRPIEARFTSGQRRVRAWVGFSGTLNTVRNVVMIGFDQSGNTIVSNNVSIGPGQDSISADTPLEVEVAGQTIRRVVIGFGGGLNTNGLVVDDFEFDTAGSPPVCATRNPPILSLTEPVSNAETQVNNFRLQGAVTSGAEIESATLTITDSGQMLNLSNIVPNNGGSFGATNISGMLAPGQNTVTMTVTNCAGTSTVERAVEYNPLSENTSFEVLGFEVTQAIQNPFNTIRLIADKKTYVRVYLRVNGHPAIDGVTASLTGHRRSASNADLPGAPIAPGLLSPDNSVDIDAITSHRALRRRLDLSLNFELPASWTAAGELHLKLSNFKIDGVTVPLLCDGCSEVVGTFNDNRFHAFVASRTIDLGLWAVPNVNTANGVMNTVLPTTNDFDMLESWLRRVYPTSELNVNRTTFTPMVGVPGIDFDATDINDLLMTQYILDALSNSIVEGTRYISIISDSVAFMQGRAIGIPGLVASGPTGSPMTYAFTQWDTDSTYGDWYNAHELAHLFGRKHPGYCRNNSSDDDSYPYELGRIGYPIGHQFESQSPVGFDVGDAALSLPVAVYDPTDNWTDVMTYCDNIWISDYTYKGLIDGLDNDTLGGSVGNLVFGETASDSVGSTEDIDTGILVAQIDLITDVVELNPLIRIPSRGTQVRTADSEYRIHLLSDTGELLADYPTVPQEATHSPPGRADALIADVINMAQGTSEIKIMKSARELASLQRSPASPSLDRVSARLQADGRVALNWVASDADDQPLFATVMVSSDSGKTFRTVATRLHSQSYSVDASELPGTRSTRFRIIVSDGFNSVSRDTGPIAITDKPPTVSIVSPSNSVGKANTDRIVFSGFAHDLEDGQLAGDSLEWRSSLQGELGSGRYMTAMLRPGRHTISLTAADRNGNTSVAKLPLTISRLPPIANAGEDRVGRVGQSVILDGIASSGAGDLKFAWHVVSQPDGGAARLRGDDSGEARFVARQPGVYEIQLTVEDRFGLSGIDSIVIELR